MKTCETYTATEARENLSEIINTALYRNPVIITRHKQAVAVVPLALLQKLTDLEAKNDANLAEKALKEYNTKGGTTLEKFKEELDL